MSKIDEIESWKLQARISDIEHQLSSSGASAGSSTSMLVEILNDAKKQLTGLQIKEQSHHDDERRKADAQLVAVVQLVAQETALNQRERQQYGAFIQKEFFTKNDFTALEDFYASAWDRLTDGGKAQMSHRVWEGVRRDEYQFSELPEKIKEKEALQLYGMLSGAKQMPEELNNIPQADRDDFTRAWNSGRKNEAYAVLNRSSFKDNLAVTPREVNETRAVESTKLETKAITTSEEKPTQKTETAQIVGKLDLAAIDISLGNEGSKAISPVRLSEPKTAKSLMLGEH
jgi:hypothetical protein